MMLVFLFMKHKQSSA